MYVGQSEAEPLHIMPVAGRNSVKLLEYFLKVLLPDTDSVVGNHDFEPLVGYIVGAD